jgi:hypothetical protein
MLKDNPRLDWMKNPDIRPYVFVRSENRIKDPGSLHGSLDWFEGEKPVYINPLEMDEVGFGNQILQLEAQAFGPSNMAMPRWVFFDCAVTPGFVAGYAIKTKSLDPEIRKQMNLKDTHEWTPLSLFIIIPTMSREGEWVAHNLCSVNALLPKGQGYYGLGFLSKAFGLWYANVNICCGFTQWGNAAIKLHSYYGPFQILTAYTPLHSYARTLTYRVKVNPQMWPHFFSKEPLEQFDQNFKSSGRTIKPKEDQSLIDLQTSLEGGEGPFFLNSQEILAKDVGAPLNLFQPVK